MLTIILEGGMVQAIITDNPEEIDRAILVIDYDTDGLDNNVLMIEQSDERKPEPAIVSVIGVTKAEINIQAVLEVYSASVMEEGA